MLWKNIQFEYQLNYSFLWEILYLNIFCFSLVSSLSKSSSPIGSNCDSPLTPSTIMSYSGVKRPKRNRTSFKHQQLRQMKQYFNLNHNPDSKDLKQLSQRTGLSKRVLQVIYISVESILNTMETKSKLIP